MPPVSLNERPTLPPRCAGALQLPAGPAAAPGAGPLWRARQRRRLHAQPAGWPGVLRVCGAPLPLRGLLAGRPVALRCHQSSVAPFAGVPCTLRPPFCPPPPASPAQGLSGMVRDGSPLHRPVLGSLAGVALEARRAWFNAGYFARGEGAWAGGGGGACCLEGRGRWVHAAGA